VQRVKAVPQSFVLDLSGDEAGARREATQRRVGVGMVPSLVSACHPSRGELSSREFRAVVPLKLPPAEWSLLPVGGFDRSPPPLVLGLHLSRL